MSEQPSTAFHRTITPPAYKRLPLPSSYGQWQQTTADTRTRLNEYERARAGGERLEPALERQLERRLRRRERDGRLGPPPPIF